MTAIVLFLLNCFFDTDVQATDYIFFSLLSKEKILDMI